MTSRLRNVTVDCADPHALATFWSAVTGYELDPDFDAEEAWLHALGDGPGILFLRVPEGSCYRPVVKACC